MQCGCDVAKFSRAAMGGVSRNGCENIFTLHPIILDESVFNQKKNPKHHRNDHVSS